MNEHLLSDLGRYADGHTVSISEAPGHIRLNINRSGISISLLIPRTVAEWWVEVVCEPGGKKVEDWCDYAGYAATSDPDLTEDMRSDVVRFIESAISRPLRIANGGQALEWNVGGNWIQAVPLGSGAEHFTSAGARRVRS